MLEKTCELQYLYSGKEVKLFSNFIIAYTLKSYWFLMFEK